MTDTKQAATGDDAREKGGGRRGRKADRPSEIPATGWKDILWRLKSEIAEDRITLIAAGVTFYLLLALFPAMATFVAIYGFVADPREIAGHVTALKGVLPSGGLDLIGGQLEKLASQNTGALRAAFILGLATALWSANNGIKALFEAMNVAYGESEKRGFIRLHLVTLAFTLGAIVIGVGLIVAVGVVPVALAFLDIGESAATLVRLLRWPIILFLTAAAITLVYRYGPSRERAQLRWVTWGAILATVVWLVASVAFSYYIENFADYNATYGTLGAVIGFMMWMWLSVVILIVGAELNAEMEHQTAKDSTTGAPQPIGRRGATMADTVGEPADSRRGE